VLRQVVGRSLVCGLSVHGGEGLVAAARNQWLRRQAWLPLTAVDRRWCLDAARATRWTGDAWDGRDWLNAQTVREGLFLLALDAVAQLDGV
jgi:hypothetical protein